MTIGLERGAKNQKPSKVLGVCCDKFRIPFLHGNLTTESARRLLFLSSLARADRSIEANIICLNLCSRHAKQKIQRLLPLPAPFASTDARIEDDVVGSQLRFLHGPLGVPQSGSHFLVGFFFVFAPPPPPYNSPLQQERETVLVRRVDPGKVHKATIHSLVASSSPETFRGVDRRWTKKKGRPEY